MSLAANETVGGTNWERLYARVRAARDDQRRALIRAAMAAAVLAPALWWVTSAWGIAVLGSLAAVAVSLFPAWKRARDVVRVAPPEADLLQFCRMELDKRLAQARHAVGYNVAACAVMAMLAIWLGVHEGPITQVLLAAGLGLGFLGLALNVRLRMVPRLEREYAQLN